MYVSFVVSTGENASRLSVKRAENDSVVDNSSKVFLPSIIDGLEQKGGTGGIDGSGEEGDRGISQEGSSA